MRTLNTELILAGLDAKPELLAYRDDKGRNWLHLCAGVNASDKHGVEPADAIPLAKGLIDRGLDVHEPAFTEDSWQATPLWFAVSRGRNIELVRFLLGAGASPEHCIWAAAFEEDIEMLRLLVDAGASLEVIAENEPPLLGAVKYSKFEAAKFLLEAGADPDFRDIHGMTALHYMLKKGSDSRHFDMFVDHGARGDIANPDGKTAREILLRKRGPGFHRIADALQ
jgi:ankyrin repeat protein